jgi:Fe-S-cluster containining protein
MKEIPWSEVETWSCCGCGECCRPYSVPLSAWEWTRITQSYGASVTEISIDGLFLKKKQGRCIFQYMQSGKWLCSIQHLKPLACKLWPFKIFRKPKFGRAEKATLESGGRKLFVYADPLCPTLKLGEPSEEFLKNILPEFIGISLSAYGKQYYSTMGAERAYQRHLLARSRMI